MSESQALISVLLIAAATVLTRALPFIIFPSGKETPAYIRYLGKVLPCAAIGMLVVYCVKAVKPLEFPYGLPELISIALVAVMQFWKKNTLLSIFAGTVLYMLLVQLVF
ncbi:MAG: branched-chain amino acid transporter permease [Oscillospiraceae bacterium]|jgi:branched-subunit amino acid transport protein AzlD|nr:branched-chain amino acid transporter permease [Oscillospiraceae bacterium]